MDQTMKPTPAFHLALALTTCALSAQATDVGLTMSSGVPGVVLGQDCGAATCQPLPGGTVAAGELRALVHYSDSVSAFAIVIGLPGRCTTLPGIDNPILLATPIVFELGVTSTPGFVPLACHPNTGFGGATLTIPVSIPPGIVFRVQSLGISPSSGRLAFGPAIESTTS